MIISDVVNKMIHEYGNVWWINHIHELLTTFVVLKVCILNEMFALLDQNVKTFENGLYLKWQYLLFWNQNMNTFENESQVTLLLS